ncbi:MAG TPA: hypoxanthine-guanine phosphoribosyltransferase [Luteimonas sp.]|jgi:hypoxanthine phosphoribosyltransferase|nr:hypoxanthine-guanine phosphoribosyltransferase [Luteimonas sp.]
MSADPTAVPGLAAVLPAADLIHGREAVEAAIDGMAARIAADYAGVRPVFLTVMHGALPFAAQLALGIGARGLDIEMDYLHATRYRGATSGGELLWKRRPETALRGRHVLLVDDIVDEGHTLDAVRAWCVGQGARDVRIAAMVVKRHDRCVAGLCADYAGLDVPDRYVFGYGMDYHEQGRNLPAIYALADADEARA